MGPETPEFSPKNPQRFAAAIGRFDAENARDHNRVATASGPRPRELAYSEWLSTWLVRLRPAASEELRLAARAQHLCRWIIPRDTYPMTRSGYLQWRTELRGFHARRAGEILSETGYPPEVVTRVQDLISKRNFPRDPESRVLEDALCLVFLEHQLGELAAKTPEAKIVAALAKAWKKMTPAARQLATQIVLGAEEKALLDKALSGSG